MKNHISSFSGICIVGGTGRRLMPLTNDLPKAMLPVGLEKKPMLDFVIKPWIGFGLKNFVFCTGYKSEVIEKHYGNGKDFAVRIKYSREKSNLETGGAIKNAIVKKTFNKNAPVIVFYCDDLVRLDPINLIKMHLSGIKNGFKATIVTTNKFKTNYGIVEVKLLNNGLKKVVSFKEKPLIEKNANVGIYIFEPEVIKLIDEHRPPFKLEEVILPELVKRSWLTMYEISWEDWMPVNTSKEYRHATEIDLTKFYSKFL